MNAKHVFLALVGGVIITLVGIIGTAYGVTSMLQTKATQLADSKAEVGQLNKQRTGLTKAKRDVARYAALEKITKSVVPQDKDQAKTVREITNIAAANKISLTTITFPSSTLGSAAPSTSAAVSAATAAKPNLSQLSPVTNISGVYNLQITIGNNSNNTVTFNQLDALLRGLENNRRTAAVSSLSIQPQQEDPSRIVFTLVINTYIKPS